MLAALLLAQAPAVVSRSPENGASDVDPATSELVVTFDHDMDAKAGVSICGGGATFPRIASMIWQDARTLVLHVRLEPDTTYVMPLNCGGSAQRLRDASGARLPETPWSFATAAGRAADEAQRARNAEALDALRVLVDTEYSYGDRVVTDWAARFAECRESALSAGTDAAFGRRIGALLGAARDPHVWIGPREALAPTFSEARPANVDLQLLEKVVPHLEKTNGALWYGRFEDEQHTLGYLLILNLGAQEELQEAQDILDELASTCDALVLDLRANGGGNELLAFPIASWFVRGTKVYAAQVLRDPATGAWDRKTKRTILGRQDGHRFEGPVAALIGQHCMSSGEGFTLMLRQGEHVVLVGDRTAGASGNPVAHTLPNGTIVWLPSWRALDAAGHPLEGVGIAPDVEVKTTPADFREHDPVLDAALAELRKR